MKQAVKILAFITISVFVVNHSIAQLKLPVVNNIGFDIKKVIDDYPNHFSNLQGELIMEHPQSADYQCNFNVNGAEQVTVTQYSSKTIPVGSWQALMLTTEEFREAKREFKTLYNQLNNLAVQASYLKGAFEAPTEEKKFTSVVFSFNDAADELKKLKVEIVMVYELMEWKVKVLVYTKEREDNERGNTIEE
ncbi:MAG TPA: hypothetical protein VF487_03445 [Chitinophagaceae bacterium]